MCVALENVLLQTSHTKDFFPLRIFVDLKSARCRYSNKNSVVSRNNLKQVKNKILPQAG
jgi:hypothetical protein